MEVEGVRVEESWVRNVVETSLKEVDGSSQINNMRESLEPENVLSIQSLTLIKV